MKTNKLTLPIIILAVAVASMAIFGIATNIARKPKIAEHEFPFSITYELKGKTETFEGVYAVSYTGNGGYTKETTRQYEGKFVTNREDANTSMILSLENEGKDGTIYLHTHLHADYLMGDPAYDYFTDYAYAPMIVYTDPDYVDHEDAETVLKHGAKLISWEYPEPIENTFVFSHIAPISSDVVLPFVVIAALALLAMIVLVKKEQELPKSKINLVSVILNVVIAVAAVPYSAAVGYLSDINGSTGELIHQLLYVLPAMMVLGLAASVALRRKGYGKGSLIVQLVAPGVEAIILALMLISA